MRSLPNALKNYINEEYHYYPRLNAEVNKNMLRLIEDKNDTYVQINLKDRDFDNIFCFSIDKDGDKIFPFFNPKVKGLCVKNDFTLVHQLGKKVVVLLIELKSNNQKGFYEQLQTGKLLFQFILEKIKLCDSDFQDISNVEYRAILFRKPRMVSDKFKSSQKEPKKDIPITYHRINEAYHLSQFV